MPDLSVLMLACDRERQLPATLAALCRQTYPSHRWELVLVNDGSRDRTARVAGDFRPPFAYRYLERANTNCRAAARNLALHEARGPIVLFLDAECIAAPTLVAAHAARHLRRGCRAVSGGFRMLAGVVPASWPAEEWSRLYRLPEAGTPYLPRGRGKIPPLWVTAHASCRREDALAVGMFDESFTGYGGEDLDMGQRLARAGIRVAAAPELVVFHQAHLPAPDRQIQAAAAERRLGEKHYHRWRIRHMLDPPGDLSLARRVIGLLHARELAQYRAEVVAEGRAALEVRRSGLPCRSPRLGPVAGPPPDLVHLHTRDPARRGTSVTPPVLITCHTEDRQPSGRSAGMDAKLWYDILLCGARYPGLEPSAAEGSPDLALVG